MYYNSIAVCGSNSVVECFLAKEDVASSSLVSRSIKDTQKSVLYLFNYPRKSMTRLESICAYARILAALV